jgi:3-polyprenyl-4-hydroxybenzoate decarboxylase
VSDDVPLDNDTLLLWGIFTRFDCASDCFFAESHLEGILPVHSGPLGIDATWKHYYPVPVLMRPETTKSVNARWKELGF